MQAQARPPEVTEPLQQASTRCHEPGAEMPAMHAMHAHSGRIVLFHHWGCALMRSPGHSWSGELFPGGQAGAGPMWSEGQPLEGGKGKGALLLLTSPACACRAAAAASSSAACAFLASIAADAAGAAAATGMAAAGTGGAAGAGGAATGAAGAGGATTGAAAGGSAAAGAAAAPAPASCRPFRIFRTCRGRPVLGVTHGSGRAAGQGSGSSLASLHCLGALKSQLRQHGRRRAGSERRAGSPINLAPAG